MTTLLATVDADDLAGDDGEAVTADVLRNLIVHPLTDRDLDQLLNDLSKQRETWADV